MLTDGLSRILSDEDDIEAVDVAPTGDEGVAMAQSRRHNVALVDFDLPDLPGLAIARRMAELAPPISVLLLVGIEDDRSLVAAIDAGCAGLVNPAQSALDVIAAVRLAATGRSVVSPAKLSAALRRLGESRQATTTPLTKREIEVLGRLARGESTAVIAQGLFISVNTVRNHIQRIIGKLGAHSKLEAVARAIRAGIVVVDDGGTPD